MKLRLPIPKAETDFAHTKKKSTRKALLQHTPFLSLHIQRRPQCSRLLLPPVRHIKKITHPTVAPSSSSTYIRNCFKPIETNMNFGMRCAHSWNILGRRHHASCFRHCYTINHIRRGFRYLAGWISGLRISDRASCCQFYIWRSVRSVCVRVPPIFFQATDNFCVIFFLLLVCCYDNSPEKKKKTRKRSSPNICVSFVSIFCVVNGLPERLIDHWII